MIEADNGEVDRTSFITDDKAASVIFHINNKFRFFFSTVSTLNKSLDKG